MIKLLLPKGKIEWILFFLFFTFYLICSYSIVFNTSLIDNYHFPTDIYFSYDNTCFYYRGYQSFTPHPLILAFTKPLVLIGDFINHITDTYKNKTLFIAVCLNILSTMSIIYVYKYLISIIDLRKCIAILLVIMYVVFTTSIMQSFTFESFTLSTFAITFTLLYFSLKNKKNETIPLYACIILPVIVGGITITNLAIALLPILLSNGKKMNIAIKLVIPCFILLILMIYVENKYHFTSDIATRLESFRPTDFSFFDKTTLFLGSTFLMPELSIFPKMVDGKKINDMIMFNDFNAYWQYVFIYGTLLLAFIPCIVQYKNKNIIALTFIILYNILIHIIVRYGLNEPFIYGGHWVYIIPILLGYTYVITKNKRIKYTLGIIYSLIFIVLAINNGINFGKFIDLSEITYPPF